MSQHAECVARLLQLMHLIGEFLKDGRDERVPEVEKVGLRHREGRDRQILMKELDIFLDTKLLCYLIVITSNDSQ